MGVFKRRFASQLNNFRDKFSFRRKINVLKGMFTKEHIKLALRRQLGWPKIRRKIQIFTTFLMIAIFLLTPIVQKPPQAKAEPITLTATAVAAILAGGCGLGMFEGMIWWSFKHGGILADTKQNPEFIKEMGISCVVGAIFVWMKIPGVEGWIKDVIQISTGITYSEMAGWGISEYGEQLYHIWLEPLWPVIMDNWWTIFLLTNPVTSSNFVAAESLKIFSGESSEIFDLFYDIVVAYESDTGNDIQLDPYVPSINMEIVEPLDKVFNHSHPVQVIVTYDGVVQDCSDTQEGIGTEINFVQFGYSFTNNENDIQPLPTNDSIDAKDYYGCNGWGFPFDIEATGIGGPTSIYLASRVEDVYGAITPWQFSTLLTADPRFTHDYEVTNLNFTPSAPNVGETVSVSAEINNVGTNNEGSVRVELRKNGAYQNGANISALFSGSSTTASFNIIAEQGAHTYEIVAELSGDDNPTNDSASGTVIVGTAPSLQINGSSNPGALRITATTEGSTGSFNVTIQNIGSAATNVTVNKGGTKANWITLGNDPGTMDAYSTEYYNFSINVPAGEPAGTSSAELTFSWADGAPIILPIEFDVVSTGNGFDTRPILPSSGTINGDISESQTYFQPDYPFATRLDNYSSTADPSSITRNFSLTENEYYRIQADSSNELSVDVTEIEEDPNGSGIWYQLNTWEQNNYSDFIRDYDVLDELIVGQNSLTFGLTDFQADLNNVIWDFEYTLNLDYTTSAWWGTLNVPLSDLARWSAGWDAGYVCAHIDTVDRAGDVILFNNKSPVRTIYIDSGDVGNDVCWRVSESAFDTTNDFNFKANLNGAQASLSNIHWEITYLSGRPALQATRSLSALQADVDQNVVATLSFENIGTNFAVDPAYSDSLPTGLQLVNGSLSGEVADVDPGGTSIATYTFRGTNPGTYVIPGSLVQYYDPSNFAYVNLFDNSVVEIWGGMLFPTLDALDSGVAGTPVSLSATLTDTLIGANVENAQLIADITRPDSSVIQVALQWHPASEKYLGNYTPNQPGVHQIVLNANKAYFDPGSSAATDWNVSLPNQAPVAHASYTSPDSGDPLEITLDASNTVDVDGVILSYVWDINNNGVITTTGRTVTHTFTSEGEYEVLLTVTDNDGESDTELITIYVGSLTFENPMLAGWNLVSIPIESVTILTAETLCQEIGSAAVEVDRWSAGGWDSHVCGLPFNDFEIVIGKGYFVRLLVPDAWSVTGTALNAQVNISFSPGWNLVSLPQGISYTASQLGAAINAQGGYCSEIDQWIAGGWNSYIIGLPFNDFVIEPGEGYFIRCSGNSTFSVTP